MTTTSTLDTVAPTNGEFIDNRPHIVVDAKNIETWELMVFEEQRINDWMMVFARYLYKGDRPVSPDLPADPLDELTGAQKAQIRNSDAFKYLKRMKVATLRAAVESFAEQASAGF